jgi:hypothetical protein
MSWATVGNFAKRIWKITPDLLVGDVMSHSTKSLENTMRGIKGADGKRTGGLGWKNLPDQFEKALKAGEGHVVDVTNKEGGFFKRLWKNLSDWSSVRKEFGESMKFAKGKGAWDKVRAFGGGSLRGLMTKMPLIAVLMIGATEIPNVLRATFGPMGDPVTGAGEIVKAGVRLTAGTILGIVSQALIPIPLVGAIPGFILGDWLASKVVGRSHTEKLEELKAEMNKNKDGRTDLAAPYGNGINPNFNGSVNQFAPAPGQMFPGGMNGMNGMNGGNFSDDFMMNAAMASGSLKPPNFNTLA